MVAKSSDIETGWVDPDDAPELTGDEMDLPDAVWTIGGRQVTPKEGKTAFREMLKIDIPANNDRQNNITEGVAVFPV